MSLYDSGSYNAVLHNFIGIDLGTTNSVLSFGNVNADGIIVPEVASYLSNDPNSRTGREMIFPSCVYYRQGEEPTAGEVALLMSRRQGNRVIKSAKSFMGTSTTYNIDGKTITPAEVLSVVLRQLCHVCRECVSSDPNYKIDDAVITVPASFTDDQLEDVLYSAKLAGIRTENADGTPRFFRLEEPRAALYDFINLQERGKIPATLIDFSTPKVVLVFDLGGGTLDISIHLVGMVNGRVDVIEDYAVSPHTLLGGDKFDGTFRKYLIDVFNSKNKTHLTDEDTDDAATQIALSEFLNSAEKGKRLLNGEIDLKLRNGPCDYDSVSVPVRRPNIYGNYSLDCRINAAEYRKIISPYLGNGISINILKDSEALQRYFMNPANRDTIIYPILTTMQNARKKINEKRRMNNQPELRENELPKIDAVLLNGGMSRLFAVRERLREFFGFEPVTGGDPEFAVSRGAVVYHYKMHLGEHVARIRNADIGLQMKDGTLKKLITAGTPLPYLTEFDTLTTVDDALSVDLPFYVGSGTNINDARCKPIAVRSVRFMNGAMPKNTSIRLSASFDEMGVLTVSSADFDSPVKVDVKRREDIPQRIAPVAVRKVTPAPLLLPGTKTQDIRYCIRSWKTSCENWQKMELSGDIELTRKNREATMKLESIIEEAFNGYEAIPFLVRLIDEKIPRVSKRSMKMLGSIVMRWHNKKADLKVADGIGKLHDICATLDPDVSISENEFAIDSLARLCRREDEAMFVKYLNEGRAGIWSNGYLVKFCNALARTGHTPEAVNALGKYTAYTARGVRISAYWALGRMGSREKINPVPAQCLEPVLEFMLPVLRREYHGEAARNGIYALGELCDQRFKDVSCVSDKIVSEAEDVIDVLLNRDFKRSNLGVERYAATSLAMMKGEKLSAEQEMHLLEIRESE